MNSNIFKLLFSCSLPLLLFFLVSTPVFAINPPVQISPANGAEVSTVTLTWEAPAYDLYSGGKPYRIQVDDEQTFSSVNKDYYTYLTTYSPSLLPGIWYWRIKSKDSSGNWSGWSNIRNFTLVVVPTSIPNPVPDPIPTPTTTPTPSSPSSSPTSFPSSATYQINEVKDRDGTSIPSVKIHVDGNYVHHYAPEKLIFCDNCQCYDGVVCSLGTHEITLSKNGYSDWSENKTINPGDTIEVNPTMMAIEANISNLSSKQSSQDQATMTENKANPITNQVSPVISSKTATIALSVDQKKKIVSSSGVLAEILSATIASQSKNTLENKIEPFIPTKEKHTSINIFFLIAGVFITSSAGFVVWRQRKRI